MIKHPLGEGHSQEEMTSQYTQSEDEMFLNQNHPIIASQIVNENPFTPEENTDLEEDEV